MILKILISFLLGGCSFLLSGYSTLAAILDNQIDIELTVETDRHTYSQSEEVKITMTVKNNGVKSVSLEFPTSRQHDFIIKKDEKEVWRWSGDKYFAQAFTTMVIEPGDSLTYTTGWAQTDSIGNHVGPGRYWIVGIVPAIGREFSVSTSIIIVNGKQ